MPSTVKYNLGSVTHNFLGDVNDNIDEFLESHTFEVQINAIRMFLGFAHNFVPDSMRMVWRLWVNANIEELSIRYSTLV